MLSHISQTELNIEAVNLSLMVEEAANELKLSTPDRHVEFIIQNKVIVYGDPRLLIILINNLLNNAFKFSSKKTKSIIEFGCLKNSPISSTTYFVRDNGSGFDMRYSDKLFRPFERLHSNSEFPGTGIGLASTNRLIKRHSGKIWGEGKPDMGATFYFTLPENKNNSIE
jgi:light-regulated signal transduction histidine kinase (bacteriophytochrome)